MNKDAKYHVFSISGNKETRRKLDFIMNYYNEELFEEVNQSSMIRKLLNKEYRRINNQKNKEYKNRKR